MKGRTLLSAFHSTRKQNLSCVISCAALLKFPRCPQVSKVTFGLNYKIDLSQSAGHLWLPSISEGAIGAWHLWRANVLLMLLAEKRNLKKKKKRQIIKVILPLCLGSSLRKIHRKKSILITNFVFPGRIFMNEK